MARRRTRRRYYAPRRRSYRRSGNPTGLKGAVKPLMAGAIVGLTSKLMGGLPFGTALPYVIGGMVAKEPLLTKLGFINLGSQLGNMILGGGGLNLGGGGGNGFWEG